MSDAPAEDDVQFCSFCSEPFPADDPMVDYDGATFCSPDCVREMLNNDDPCDHAKWVEAVGRFDRLLSRVLVAPDPEPPPALLGDFPRIPGETDS